MNSIGTKATIRIAGPPNLAATTNPGSAAASEYAGAVDATPMTTFVANEMAFFFSACVMSKRNVPSALGKAGRLIIVGDLTGLAIRHNKHKPRATIGVGTMPEKFFAVTAAAALGCLLPILATVAPA